MLLDAVARSLTACERAGLAVELRYGIVMTRYGIVLPLANGRWEARTLVSAGLRPGVPSGGG